MYGSDTVAPGRTMVELHSNFTFEGFKVPIQGVLPDEHQLHETVEITQGWTNWCEAGFYIFTSYGPGQGYKWVGDHIRPRVRAPDSWHWPVGVSISTEIGYQRPIFSADTWTWEIRPIVDKQWKSWYLFQSRPGAVISWPQRFAGRGVFAESQSCIFGDTKTQRGLRILRIARPVTGFDPLFREGQQFFPAIDYDFGPNWEFNFGVGVGATRNTDHLMVKMILGHRFRFITPRMPRALRPNPAGGEE